MEHSLKPLIKARFDTRELPSSFFRLFGIPESYVGQAVADMNLPSDIEVSYRAVSPEVHLMFKCKDSETAVQVGEAFQGAISDSSCIIGRDKNEGLRSLW